MLKGWKNIDSYVIEILQNKYIKKSAKEFQFHHSIIQCINDKMLYKIVNNVVFVAKKSAIMGNYSMILYNKPFDYIGDYSEFLEAGISIRNNYIEGKKDHFGVEYVYDCDSNLRMEGSQYRRHRNAIKRYSPTYEMGNNEQVSKIVYKWSENNKSVHQIKLYKTICHNLNLVDVTRIYVNKCMIGFSVVEHLNDGYGIIVQRLINPEIKGITEPNILIHYIDCQIHRGMLLNMGGCGGLKNLEFAKRKLNPKNTLQINRIQTKNKLTQKQYIKINKPLEGFFGRM